MPPTPSPISPSLVRWRSGYSAHVLLTLMCLKRSRKHPICHSGDNMGNLPHTLHYAGQPLERDIHFDRRYGPHRLESLHHRIPCCLCRGEQGETLEHQMPLSCLFHSKWQRLYNTGNLKPSPAPRELPKEPTPHFQPTLLQDTESPSSPAASSTPPTA